MLWMLLTLMTVLAAVGLTVPLMRRRNAGRTRSDTLSVLKEQMGELETQSAGGAIPEREAEALKTDLKRRLLAEGRQAEAASRPLGERALLGLAFALVAVITLGATGLYLSIGRPDVASVKPQVAAAPPADGDHPQADVPTMIAQLEAGLKANPGNAEGWRMLGWSYLQTGKNAEAANAYGRAAALDPANAEYLSAQGEATVLAAQGEVTPAAQSIFRKAVAADAADPRARYYLAMAKDQAGDHKGAMADWITLIKSAPADASWAPEVRGFVEKLAADRGMDIRAQLPPPQPVAAAGAPGPTSDQVAAAQQMNPSDRQAMIEAMVGRLASDLKANPRNRDGWERLMRSQMVLGRPREAAAAYRDARNAFAGSPGDQQALRQTATSLGVPGA
jgi:cytochrome c-type biogenesis protein CcmH